LEREPDIVLDSKKLKGTVEWKDLSTEEILINADVSKDCVLLITDNYSQSWTVEDLPGSGLSHHEVMPGDYFLKAIPLKKGHHHFLLAYRPKAFEAGKWVTIFSCFLYVAILLFHFWKNSRFSKEVIS
jgi:uncharacterized membrane protein YfhO